MAGLHAVNMLSFKYGSRLVLGSSFSVSFWGDLLFCPFSLQLAAFLSWKLSFQRYLQHFGAQTVHTGLYFVTRGHLVKVEVRRLRV